MKAAEFYKILDGVLHPPYDQLEIQRLKGTVSRWVAVRPQGRLFFEFKTNQKYPWQIYGGGTFEIWIYRTTELKRPFSEIARDHACGRLFDKWPDTEYSKIADVNAAVLRKASAVDLECLKSEFGPEADDYSLKLLHRSAIKSIEMSLDARTLQGGCMPSLHYYDDSDVREWGALILRNTPTLLSKIDETSQGA